MTPQQLSNEQWELLRSLLDEAATHSMKVQRLPLRGTSFEDLGQELLLKFSKNPNQASFLLSLPTRNRQVGQLWVQLERLADDLREKTVVDNLLDRVTELAAAGQFYRKSFGDVSVFSSTELPGPPRQLEDREIRSLARLCSDIYQIMDNPSSERKSMVYTTSNLKILKKRVLEVVEGISKTDLRQYFEILLSSRLARPVIGDMEAVLERQTMQSEEITLAMSELVTEVVEKIPFEMRAAFYATAQGIPMGIVATEIGAPRTTVINRLNVARSVLQDILADLDGEQLQIASELLVVSFEDAWIQLTEGIDDDEF